LSKALRVSQNPHLSKVPLVHCSASIGLDVNQESRTEYAIFPRHWHSFVVILWIALVGFRVYLVTLTEVVVYIMPLASNL
jgi:hypothetical protein